MLLLVLILVMVAFGLLVVALLSSSVLWAWVSVGMSVAAASALLVDWLQRRSSLRDEAEGGGPAADRDVRPVELADIEPVTELIPVVRPPDVTAHRSTGNGVAAGYSGDDRAAAFSDPRFDLVGDSAQTVLMPIVQPSGSEERPSGATRGTNVVDGMSLPSVTFPETEDLAHGPGSDGEWAVPDPDTMERRDAAAPADERRNGTEPTEPTEPADELGGDPAAEPSPDVDPKAAAARAAGPMVSPFGPEDPSTEAGQEPVAARPDLEPDSPGSIPDAGDDHVGDDHAGDETTTVVRSGGTAVAEQPEIDPRPPDRAGDADPEADPEATVIVRSVRAAGQGAPLPPVGPDGEPPEESRNAAAAALVAVLEDEVVVVDERPRYHLPHCPSVTANPLIPLPVREAVEYGFTPCGWCAPDRTLSVRHRITAS